MGAWIAYERDLARRPTLGEMMRNAVGNVADNIKATRATLVTELSIDELSTLDSIIPPHTAIINSNEESSAFRSHYASGLPAAFTLECTTMAAAPYLDADMVQKVKDFVDSLDGTEKKLAAVKIAILNFAYWVAWQACSSTIIQRGGYVGPVEGFSNLPPLQADSTNPFSLVSGLSDTLRSGESDSFAVLTDLFQSIQSDYDTEHPEEEAVSEDVPAKWVPVALPEELRALSSNYILRGPLSILSVADTQKIQDYVAGHLSPDSFHSLAPEFQASKIREILSELGIPLVISAPLASAAAVLSRVGEDRNASAEVMSKIYLPSDAETMMDAAASFLTTEEVTAFKRFLGLEPYPNVFYPPSP
jgi:hypothetical protein